MSSSSAGSIRADEGKDEENRSARQALPAKHRSWSASHPRTQSVAVLLQQPPAQERRTLSSPSLHAGQTHLGGGDALQQPVSVGDKSDVSLTEEQQEGQRTPTPLPALILLRHSLQAPPARQVKDDG